MKMADSTEAFVKSLTLDPSTQPLADLLTMLAAQIDKQGASPAAVAQYRQTQRALAKHYVTGEQEAPDDLDGLLDL